MHNEITGTVILLLKWPSYTEIIYRVGPNGWMDELQFNVPFNSISFISGRWKGEHEKHCAMNRRLGSEIILPPAGLEHETP